MGVNQLQQQNVAAAAAYTEYSVAIPTGVIDITIVVRPTGTPANLFWYTAPSGSSSPGSSANLPAVYNTLPASSGGRTLPGKFGGQVIYFQLDQSNQVVEVDYHGDT